MQLVSLLEGLDGLYMAIFIRSLGWQELEVNYFLENAKKEFYQKRGHLYWPT